MTTNLQALPFKMYKNILSGIPVYIFEIVEDKEKCSSSLQNLKRIFKNSYNSWR